MIATRFAVAVHILLFLAVEPERATSPRLAQSVNTNPVVVRRISGQLARAGLISVRRGPGGARLQRSPESISLASVWDAVHPGRSRPMLPLHANPAPDSRVGGRVKAVLAPVFSRAETAMHEVLASVTLDRLAAQIVAGGTVEGATEPYPA
jgi:DNA-binding IscR family transcriptional regulator